MIIYLGNRKISNHYKILSMKKKEKFYAVNNQEDEDGYTLYPGSAIIYEKVNPEQDTSRVDTDENARPRLAKSQFNSFNHLPSASNE
jgi:hypothetical protein